MDVVTCLEWAQLDCHLEMAPGGGVIMRLITSWITDINVNMFSNANKSCIDGKKTDRAPERKCSFTPFNTIQLHARFH